MDMNIICTQGLMVISPFMSGSIAIGPYAIPKLEKNPYIAYSRLRTKNVNK